MGVESSAAELATAVRLDGYAIIPGFLSADVCTEMQQVATALAGSRYALRYPKSTRVWDLYRHGPQFLDVLRDDRLKDLLTLLLGQYYLLSDYSLNSVAPGQPVDDWHIDYPYNEMSVIVSGATLGLQCVLALDDFGDLNGATQMVQGSHTRLVAPGADSVVATTTFDAEAGSLLVLAASTWHRSGFNGSEGARTAALLSFVERWVRPMNDPPEPGIWSDSDDLAITLGVSRPPEFINGILI